MQLAYLRSQYEDEKLRIEHRINEEKKKSENRYNNMIDEYENRFFVYKDFKSKFKRKTMKSRI